MKLTTDTPLYRVEGLHYAFTKEGMGQEKAVEFTLGPLDLSIAQGKFTCILGRSGSGKTTLLSLLGFLRRPQAGSLQVYPNGEAEPYTLEDIWRDEQTSEAFRAHYLGFALQRGELLPFLSLQENAALIPTFLSQATSQFRTFLQGLFGRFYQGEDKLEELARRLPREVSQGQYQRGSVVRALANEPSVILADEPTGNLDQETGHQAMATFREITREREGRQQSVVVVTHDLELALEFADEIIVLKQGQYCAHYAQPTEETWTRHGGTDTYTTDTIRQMILKDLKS